MVIRPVRGLVNRRGRRRIGEGTRLREHSTPAPVGGWNARDSLANMPETDAILMVNVFPEETQVRVRKGTQAHATNLVVDLVSLMAWRGPTSEKLFAAGPGAIYDVSTTVGSSVITSLSRNAQWQHVNFATSSGSYLYMCNGSDAPRYYDGSSWTTPTITGSGLTATDLIHVSVFKRRLFFVEKDSLSFWYFPTETLAGAITEFDLGPLASLGGHLVAAGTMSLDGGDGPDDLAVFLTSEGQAIVFAGTDPGDTDAWALVGVFHIGAPLGRRCLTRLGADLVVMTTDGFSLLSRFLAAGRSSTRAAMSDKISSAVTQAVQDNKDRFGWQPIHYAPGNLVLFNVPLGSSMTQFVSNATTGAWCRYTGLNVNAWEIYNGELYAAGYRGIRKAESGSRDWTETTQYVDIETSLLPAYTYFGSRGRKKRAAMVKPNFDTNGTLVPALKVNTDFEAQAPTIPPTFTGSDNRDLVTLLEAISNVQRSSLQLALDAGSASSYNAEGDVWADISGNEMDFVLGSNPGATTIHPSFGGNPGGLSRSEYFTGDGGDHFSLRPAAGFAAISVPDDDPEWVGDMHKNGATWTLAMWVYFANTTDLCPLFNTMDANDNNNTGIALFVESNSLHLQVGNGSGSAYALEQSTPFTNSGWRFVGVSVDEAVGSGGIRWLVDDTITSDTSTYTSPASGAQDKSVEIWESGSDHAPNGTRIMMLAGWDVALSSSVLGDIYDATLPRITASYAAKQPNNWKGVEAFGDAFSLYIKTAHQNGDIKLNSIDWRYELTKSAGHI